MWNGRHSPGELHQTGGELNSEPSIGLCAQRPWLMRGTVRDNILFGLPYDEARYAEALDQVGRHQEAVTILTRLAEDDVMPDAYGYAALSRSQDALGRTALRDRARRACEAMTRREQRGICPSFPAS